MSGLQKMDSMVKEYLLFRGMNSALKSFEFELRNDKDKSFRADKIVEQLNHYISIYDLVNLREYWQYLDGRLFRRLERVYCAAARKLEVSLLKLYLVNALQNKQPEKVTEFFEKLSPELQNQSEWKDWFALPFIKNAEENPVFAMYFTRQWQDTFWLSLHNFLSVIIHSMPAPALLSYEEDNKKIKKLKDDIETYKKQNAALMNRTSSGDHVGHLDQKDPELLSPAGSSVPGPCSMDLMDDFFVISQDTTIEEKQTPKTNQIRTFIRNIGLPSSPKQVKKPVQQSAQQPQQTKSAAQPIAAKDDGKSKSATMSVPISKVKSRLAPPGGASLVTTQPSTVQSMTSNAESKTAADTETAKKIMKPELAVTQLSVEPSANKDTPSSFFASSAVKNVDVPVEDTENHSAFILLSQEEYGEHHSSVTHCRFSHTGHSVATADVDGVVKVWSIPSAATVATIMSKSMLMSLEWVGKTDRLLLLGNKACAVRLFDIKDKKTLKEANTDPFFPRIVSLACSPTGASFVCSAAGKHRPVSGTDQMAVRAGKLTLWDLKTMKLERQLPLNPAPVAVNCTSFNHNGHLMISGAADGVIRLYDMQKCDCIAQWSAHSGEVYSVQFSSDETTCYSMGSDGKFVQWSINKTGKKVTDLPIHQGACGPFIVTGVSGYRQVQTPKGKLFAFDSEGAHVLTCAQNGGLIYKLDQKSGLNKVLSLGGHRTPVVSVDWSTSIDTKMCLTGSMDGKVQVSTLLDK